MLDKIFMEKLNEITKTNSPENIAKFLNDNLINIFSSSHIKMFYDEIKHFDFSKIDTKSMLLFSWLAFVCGDNKIYFQFSIKSIKIF